MIASIRKFLAPPVFADDEKTRKAAFLNTILLASFVIINVYLIVQPIFLPAESPLRALMRYPMIIGTWVLLRKGHVRAACIFFVVAMWLIQTFVWGGISWIQPDNIAAITVRIIITGLLLGGRMAFFFAAVSLVENALVVYAVSRNLLPRHPSSYTLGELIVEQGVWTFLTAILLSLWMSSLNQALRRARDELAERKRVEKELRATEERFSKAFHASPMPMSIGKDGVILAVNESLLRASGYTREEMLGHTLSELHFYVDAEDPIRLRRTIVETGAIRDLEIPLRMKNGEVRTHQMSAEIIELGGEPCVLAVINDITERKQAEEKQAQLQEVIHQSAKEWRRTFDSVDTSLLILDLDDRIIRLNRAAKELSGLNYDEIIGQSSAAIGSGQPWQEAAALASRIREDRRTVSVQIQDESRGTAWYITASILAGEGTDDRIIIAARDITGMVKLQESLRRSETMSAMGALVAGVAHEVRNPLFSISATLDAFEARFGERSEYRQYINVLRGELNRLNDLMRDLLEYGKPFKLELSQGSIGKVVAKAIRACQVLASRSQVTFVNRVGDDLAPVMMDRRRAVQAFQNVIENAVQHSPAGAVVTVEAEQVCRGGTCWIACRVSDSGPGFRDDELPRIFEPFFTRRRGGTGIGLSIVRRIMEEHGGKVSASTRAEGGALVELRFQSIEPSSASVKAAH
ncbi:MAG TPA: PAS domain S-box protein [Blastocatellia bacterium]|nr:PAS domain S-box protein [Blastocatellia bacterium]